MEANPYAAPQATLEEIRAYDAYDLENRKASRGKRLGAVLLDGLANIVAAIPILLGITMAGGVQHGIKPAGPMLAAMLLGLAFLVGLFVINCVMLHQSGQTIGKRMLDIAIVRTDGSRAGLRRYLFARVLPVTLLSMIPLVGWLVSLVDPLLIFGKDRRCLHDLIADTIVVDA